MVIKHGNDVDDHHTSTGDLNQTQNYELHDYETILMLTEKFQMKFWKTVGNPDAVHSYKVLTEHNKSL